MPKSNHLQGRWVMDESERALSVFIAYFASHRRGRVLYCNISIQHITDSVSSQ